MAAMKSYFRFIFSDVAAAAVVAAVAVASFFVVAFQPPPWRASIIEDDRRVFGNISQKLFFWLQEFSSS